MSGSFFGFHGDPVSCAAYDLCILEEMEKDRKEEELSRMYQSEDDWARYQREEDQWG